MTIDPESGIVVWVPTKQQVERSYQELRQINEAVIARGRLDLVQLHPLFNVLVTVKDGRGGTALQYLNVELLLAIVPKITRRLLLLVLMSLPIYNKPTPII
jgi:hypothetical protein